MTANAVPGVVVVWSGRGPLRRVFRAPAVIGRNVVGEDDDRISREHARIEAFPGGFTVTDLGSRNGTYVNGHRLVEKQVVVPAPVVVRTGRTVSIALHDVLPYETTFEPIGDRVMGARTRELWATIEHAAVRGRDVVIRGEPGVGKRTLAEAYARRRRVVPAPSAHPYRGDPPPDDEAETALVAVDFDHMGIAEQTRFALRTAQRRDLAFVVTHIEPFTARDPAFAARVARAVQIQVPPLRARFDEIPLFIAEASRETAKRLRIHATVVEQCLLRHWPSNVRELMRTIENTAGTMVSRNAALFRGEHLPEDAGHDTDLSRHCRVFRPRDIDRIVREANLRNVSADAKVRLVDDPRVTALREEVWRNPESDDARAIYADCLLEHGDPRGELIALQLARARTGERAGEHEMKLVELLGRDCAEPLRSCLRPGFTLRRGFVSACETIDKLPPDIVTHPAWSTVESIESDHIPLLTSGALVSARRLATAADITRLTSASRPLPYEVIVGRSMATRGDRVVNRGICIDDKLAVAGSLANVRSFSVEDAPVAAIRFFLGTELGRGLVHLDVIGSDADADELRDLFERSQLQLLTMRCKTGLDMLDPVLGLERGRMIVELNRPEVDEHNRIFDLVRRLGRGTEMIEVHDLRSPERITQRQRAFVERLRTVFREIIVVESAVPTIAP